MQENELAAVHIYIKVPILYGKVTIQYLQHEGH